MGQRLVIQIEENGEALANAYYHWSAYTESAADMTNDVINYLDDADKSFTPHKKAVWALYKTGARFAPAEHELMANEGISEDEFSFAFDDVKADRTDGLISVSDKGMKESEDWAEGMATIDIVTGEIYFNVYCEESREDFKKYNEDIDIDYLPILDIPSYGEMQADEWDTFYSKLKRVIRNSYAAKSSSGKTIYAFIC